MDAIASRARRDGDGARARVTFCNVSVQRTPTARLRLTFYYNGGKVVYAVFFPEFCACKASKFSYD